MPVYADCHLHSSHSGDSRASMESMIERGIALGLKQMCFTEHMDMDYPDSENESGAIFLVNTDSYLYDLIRCKEHYADRIELLFGIELGLQPHLSANNARYVHSYDFDFVIGSSHVVNGRDPYYPSYYEGRTEAEAYREYFTSILDNLKKYTNFDVYGHLDYVVRYGPDKDKHYAYADYRDVIDRILTILIENEKGIELNTAGFRKGLHAPNPCEEILRRYRELGGEIITVGSDAHAPEDVGSHFREAADILTSCGFRYYCVYQKRVAEFLKL
ncbi:MAG: histidinol-phosphatase HisJ family protein [bacterium]|nr:histidinol-phosphatase HisJ family protein [bacterium]